MLYVISVLVITWWVCVGGLGFSLFLHSFDDFPESEFFDMEVE